MQFAKEEFIGKVSRLENLLERDFSTLSATLRKSSTSLSGGRGSQRLVEQLQYHDIIRQKIQHVGQFGDLLEEEFASHPPKSEGETSVLPGLLELSMALLQFARLEYDEIREEIHMQLMALTHTAHAGSEPVYTQFQLEIQELIKSLGRLYLLIEAKETEAGTELSSAKLRKICQSFSMQSEREIFRSLFNDDPMKEYLTEPEADNNTIELF